MGKNESGKSAILRALSKMKPSDGEEYDGLREFPRRRFTDEFDIQDWPVASVRLGLDAEDVADLVEISPDLADSKSVEVTKHYSGKRTVDFRPTPAPVTVARKEAVTAAERARQQLADARAPEGHGDQLGGLKPQIDAAIQQAVSALPNTGALPVASTDALLQSVNQFMNEAWHDAALDKDAGPGTVVSGRCRRARFGRPAGCATVACRCPGLWSPAGGAAHPGADRVPGLGCTPLDRAPTPGDGPAEPVATGDMAEGADPGNRQPRHAGLDDRRAFRVEL